MKLKRTILLFGLIALITSCVGKLVSATDNEEKGVSEVVEFYGGECRFSVGVSASTSDGGSKYFELEMSKSKVIESYADVAEMPASNVAYLFYRNLEGEKSNYDKIHVILKFDDGDEVTVKYPLEQLEIVKDRMSTVEKIVELIKLKQFQEIKPFLNDSSTVEYDKDVLIANMERIDPDFGEVKEFVPYGFSIRETETGNFRLHIAGVIHRDKQNHEFSADFDLGRPKEELLKIEYKLY